MEIILILAIFNIFVKFVKWLTEPRITNIYDYDREIYGKLTAEETRQKEKALGRKIHNGK